MLVALAKYCTELIVPSVSRAFARNCTWRLNAALSVEGVIVIEGAILDAALTVTVLVGEADTFPELSRANATTSAAPGGTPANDAVIRQLFPCGSRLAWPMLLRLRKNSTPT